MELFPGYLSGGSYVKIGIGVALTYALLKKSRGHRSFIYLKRMLEMMYIKHKKFTMQNMRFQKFSTDI